MATPAVSVVVPAFKRVQLTGRAIDSVLQQTMPDFELIVVDDNSADGTTEMVAHYDDSRVHLIQHRTNRGGSAARNSGIDAARAELVALLDSDDEWLPTKLELNLQRAQSLSGSRWVLYNRMRITTEQGDRLSDSAGIGRNESVDEYLFVRRGMIQTSGVMLPTHLAREVQFDESLKRLQDWDFYLRLARAGAKFHFQSEVLSVHHTTIDSARISRELDPEFLESWIRARRGWVSRRAFRGYLANKLAPEQVQCGRRLAAARHLLSGIATGVVPWRNAIIELLRLFTTADAFDWAIRARRGP